MAPKKRARPDSANEIPKSGRRKKKGTAESPIQLDAETQPLNRSALLEQIHATLPLPMREEVCADGSIVYVAGDPGEVVIRVAQSRITISAFAVMREGSNSPVVRPQPLISLYWRRLPAARLTTLLHEMIEAARQLRRAKYCKCQRCGEIKPPEWMHDTNVCQSCDERST